MNSSLTTCPATMHATSCYERMVNIGRTFNQLESLLLARYVNTYKQYDSFLSMYIHSIDINTAKNRDNRLDKVKINT